MTPLYKVIIVDDEEIERDGLAYLLQNSEHPLEIHKMRNGREALDFLCGERADLVITDIKMPVMDGLELCRAARALYPDIHLLISSGYGEFEFAQQAIHAKVDDYILKPVIVDHFTRITDGIFRSLQEKRRAAEHVRQSPDAPDAGGSAKAPSCAIPADGSALEDERDIACKKAIHLAIALIRENFHRDISLEWIAQQVYLSAGYLSGLFHKETGLSVIQYITLCRMEKAKEYLARTNMKIVDIARRVGYNNASYFCLQFRKYHGVTAVQMREAKEVDAG